MHNTYPEKTKLRAHLRNCYFAHRGLHNIQEGIPENSLPAFEAAIEAGYGAELDVQLSKDGKVVVFHDDDLKRVCGLSKDVCDLTWEELRTLSLLGTKERICLFTEVLSLFETTSSPLLVELKAGKRNKELCAKTHSLLNDFKGIYCIESFHPGIVYWFKKNAPQIFRGQLSGNENTFGNIRSSLLRFLLRNCWFFRFNKPDFISYRIGSRTKRIQKLKENGVMFFGWTSREPGEGQKDNDALIFENYRPPVKY